MVDATAGVYVLFELEDPGRGPVTSLAITAQEENCFSIRGLDQAWAGEGTVEGQHGRYCWRFENGWTGQTHFTINPDGTLTGHVVGSGTWPVWHWEPGGIESLFDERGVARKTMLFETRLPGPLPHLRKWLGE